MIKIHPASIIKNMCYFIIFGKFVDDKEDGIYLSSVCFGGMANSKDDAESIASQCSKNTKGGIIVVRIFDSVNSSLPETINKATTKFYEIERRMVEAEDIYSRNNKKKS